jgi:hypothetical protein
MRTRLTRSGISHELMDGVIAIICILAVVSSTIVLLIPEAEIK